MVEVDDSPKQPVRVQRSDLGDFDELVRQAEDQYAALRYAPGRSYPIPPSVETSLVGRLGERAVARFLESAGFHVVETGESKFQPDILAAVSEDCRGVTLEVKTSRFKNWPVYGRTIALGQWPPRKVDAYAWCIVSDDPFTTESVVVVGWLLTTEVADSGQPDSYNMRITAPMRPVPDLVHWVRAEGSSPATPQPNFLDALRLEDVQIPDPWRWC